MDKYISCLMSTNEAAKESSIADFEFSQPREAVIFSQWMGAVLPIDENRWVRLPSELGWYEEEDRHPLLSESMASFDFSYFLERRYVRFVKLSKVMGQEVEFDTFACSREIRNIMEEGRDPQEFVLVDLNKKNYPHYHEPFWEYIAGCHFRERGYLVTRWTPTGVLGVPDLGAYKAPSVLNPLRRHKFVKRGLFLFELELPLIFGEAVESAASEETDLHSVVVEAKCSRGSEYNAADQLLRRGEKGGYLEGGHFDEGYIVGPDFDRPHEVGTISNAGNGELLYFECKKVYSNPRSREKALHELERLVKLVLAKNLTLSHLLELCKTQQYSALSFRGFLDAIEFAFERLTVEEVCSFVQGRGIYRFRGLGDTKWDIKATELWGDKDAGISDVR